MSDWTTAKVLDHGFVHLLDSMPHWGRGSADARVVQSARVSMAHLPDDVLASLGLESTPEERSPEQDAKLIDYLMKNAHTSPFEKVRFEFVVKLPIFIARQWIRHRTGCLAGDVQLHFERPCDGKAYPKSIADVFRSFSDPAQTARAKQMRLRCIDDASLALTTTTITSVWESGVQDVYAARTISGATIRLTDSHKVRTDRGWELFGKTRARFHAGDHAALMSTLSVPGPGAVQRAPELDEDRVWVPIPGWEGRYEASDQGRIRSTLNTHGRPRAEPKIKPPTTANNGYPSVSLSRDGVSRLHTVHSLVALAFLGETPADMEVRHKNGNRLDPRAENLEHGTSLQNKEDMIAHDAHCRLEVRPDRIVSVEHDGAEMTYDLEVADGDHNFIANGFVVHNSFNEQSARYSKLPCEFYLPAPERMQAQSTSNKQASGAVLDEVSASKCLDDIDDVSRFAYDRYEHMLSLGLARELARMVLPTNFYTQWYWTVDLHNFLGFAKLRLHPHAQWEIQEYTRTMLDMVRRVVPLSVAAWEKHRRHAT